MPHDVSLSSVEDMTVADVRKALSHMRREWQKHSAICPFFPSHALPNSDMSVSEFAFRFVMGHHYKRHTKQA